MLALPPAPQQAPKRQLFVGTALASAAGTMLLGGMLAVWLQFRADAPYRESARRGLIKDWMPEKIVVPEVAANMMLIAFFVVCIMAQWAVWSAKRGDRTHTAMALGMSALIGLAALNSQVFIWTQMGVVARCIPLDVLRRDRSLHGPLGGRTRLHRGGGVPIPRTRHFRCADRLGTCPLLVLPHRSVLGSVVRGLRAEVTRRIR